MWYFFLRRTRTRSSSLCVTTRLSNVTLSLRPWGLSASPREELKKGMFWELEIKQRDASSYSQLKLFSFLELVLSTQLSPPGTGRGTSSRTLPPTRAASPTLTSRSSVPTPSPPWWRTPGSCPSCRSPGTRSSRSRWGTEGSSSPALSRVMEPGSRWARRGWPRTWWWWPAWPTPTSRGRSRCSRLCLQLPSQPPGSFPPHTINK